MVTDPEVQAIWERHYTAHPQGRLPEHWAGPRSVRTLLEALGLEPLCRCKERGAEVVESEALGTPLVVHLTDCAWLEWTQRTGGCMGDDPVPWHETREAYRAETQGAEQLARQILEAVCRRDGLSLESDVLPGEAARNYELALRLGIGQVFGLTGAADD